MLSSVSVSGAILTLGQELEGLGRVFLLVGSRRQAHLINEFRKYGEDQQ